MVSMVIVKARYYIWRREYFLHDDVNDYFCLKEYFNVVNALYVYIKISNIIQMELSSFCQEGGQLICLTKISR